MASGLFSGWRYWVGAIPLVWGLAGAMLGVGWMLDLNTLLVMLAYPLVLGLLGLRRLRRELRRMPEQPA
jgi:hypothetical protein